MRHRIYGKHLGRAKDERRRLFKSLIRNLLLHENIQTTEAKAKAIKGLVDRLISKARENSPSSLRVVQSFLLSPEIQKLRQIALRYPKRLSGFTTRVRLGRRLGDGAMMVRLSLVEADKVEEKEKSAEKSTPLSKVLGQKAKIKNTIKKSRVKNRKEGIK